jgi:rare lipoprotein A (peptidoglycan hydrolase)
MLSVKSAMAAFLGLVLVGAGQAHAMKFEDRPGTLRSFSPPTINLNSQSIVRFEDRPGLAVKKHRDSPSVRSSAMRFADRPGTLTSRWALLTKKQVQPMKFKERLLPVARVSHCAAAHPAASCSLILPVKKAQAMAFEDRPGPVSNVSFRSTLPPSRQSMQANLVLPAYRYSMRFADRPAPALGGPVQSEFVNPSLHFGLREFCAHSPLKCDPFDFARRRAVMRPAPWDDYRLLAHVSTATDVTLFDRSPSQSFSAGWSYRPLTDHCTALSLSKQRYLACLGLPAEILSKKAEVASPLFKRAGLIPRGGGQYKIGKPYKIGGKLFRPRKDVGYDETGIASWYGAAFHRRMTANGEWFDMEYLSAAHATMPLPSYARITNLENGRELIVRVNDRGPFVAGRIIDLSKRSAETLDFKKRGTVKVRVQYVGPAPLEDLGDHLAAMNEELARGTPLSELVAAASGLPQQHAMITASGSSFTE